MAATNAGGYMTLLDRAKITDPNGGIAKIIELQQQQLGILDDIHWEESNRDFSHAYSQRTSLPTVGYRYIAEPSPASKSTNAQLNEQMGILTGWSEIPEETADIGGKRAEVRFSEAVSFWESMMETFAGKLRTANHAVTPKEFTGFYPRYNLKAGVTGQNIVDGGGVGSDNTSMLYIGWSPRTIHCIYPKGMKAGIDHKDFGLTVLQDTTVPGGTRLAVYQERWQWMHGLVIKDWRFAARGCNIDISNLVTKSSAADLPDMLIKMWHRFPHHNGLRESIVMSRTNFEMLDIQCRDDVQLGGQLKYEDVFGKTVPTFRRIPIRIDDQQLETEAQVV